MTSVMMYLIFRLIGSRRVKISKVIFREDELDGKTHHAYGWRDHTGERTKQNKMGRSRRLTVPVLWLPRCLVYHTLLFMVF